MSRQQTVETKEANTDSARRRRTVPWLLGGLVLGLLSIMIALQVAGLWSILTPDTASDTLLLYALSSLNFAAFIVFAFILVRSLLKLRRERQERQLGAKIKTRLVVYFITLSLLPITAMAVFSYLFLNRSIEKWFSNLPEGVVSVATQLQREADANQIRSLRETATMLALLIDRQPEFSSQSTLEQLVQKGNLAALEIVTTEGQVLAKSEAALTDAERLLLKQEIINARTANEAKDDKAIEHRRYDAVTVPLYGGNYLTVARERHIDSNLSENLSESQGQYDDLVSKQRKVRWLGIS
ncbi:MAG: hypothetical protein H7Y30_09405, partial [Pyrinomonadaceae bacterium]|nr:hypothetical protein [Pyrinomonadaceae bacterium]